MPRGATRYFFMSDIRNLEGIINRNLDEAIEILGKSLNERLIQAEKKKFIGRRVAAIDEHRVKAAEEAVSRITLESAKLETA